MTVQMLGASVSLTPTDELNDLLDRNRCLETECAVQIQENDDLRSCVRALAQTVSDLQRAIKEIGR